jgi:N-acetylmuramoyl-L-alanine amidase
MMKILLLLIPFLTSCQNHDLEMLARVVESEAAGESFMGKYLVASTVVNRVNDIRFPNCIPEVLIQSNQYAAPCDTFSEDSMKAAKLAMRRPHENIIYFVNPKSATNRRFVDCLKGCFDFGNHKFCTECY